jgi:A/G-specific adenine glycosylase
MTHPDKNITVLMQTLEDWFRANARDLPWRTQPRDPYSALVSEFMLQQTQVSRVLEKYQPFLDRFPTIEHLAQAQEEDVLAMWSGLGYYRRARMLHACAKAVVSEFQGQVPTEIDELINLPGVGRYTAGAISSIVFDQREPIVDGNVTRVLLRMHNKDVQQTDKATVAWSWEQAQTLVDQSQNPGVFNEAMMELGATVCTPKNIRCDLCPWIASCDSFKEGTTESIPVPKPKAKQKTIYCSSVVVEQSDSILLEQRPSTGMWANMFQTPTIEHPDRHVTNTELANALGIQDSGLEHISSFTHITTHRIVEFEVFRAHGVESVNGRAYQSLASLDNIGISNAQRKVLDRAGIL